MARVPKTMIGWKEWCALPGLGLPALRVKIDTGAKTSALHAFEIEPFTKDNVSYVRFKIHPLQANNKLTRVCEAPVIDRRFVTSSNGEREKRYVIATRIVFSTGEMLAEITLTSRHKMTFRMLLGRDALKQGKFTVSPGRAFLLGKVENVLDLYNEQGDKK